MAVQDWSFANFVRHLIPQCAVDIVVDSILSDTSHSSIGTSLALNSASFCPKQMENMKDKNRIAENMFSTSQQYLFRFHKIVNNLSLCCIL